MDTEFVTDPTDNDISSERVRLVETARDWGYFKDPFKGETRLLTGRRLLDIGMGGGPHSIGYIEKSGCKAYVGVDPLVGTTRVRDFRQVTNPSLPAYSAFPYTPQQIMQIYPNVHLYSGFLEAVQEQIRAQEVDFALMGAVTEHLQRPDEVFRLIWEILQPGGGLFYSHCGYHSWTGHHRNPRSVRQFDPADPAHVAVIDWAHLDPAHPDFVNTNFNRMRMHDLWALTNKYFEIADWNLVLHAAERLTPELRARLRHYSLAELLGQTLYVTARRRDVPLDTDLSEAQYFHPDAAYDAKQDFSSERLEDFIFKGSVLFGPGNRLSSHSDNDFGARRLFAQLRPGERLRLTRHFDMQEFTVDHFEQSSLGENQLVLRESLSADLLREAPNNWHVDAVATWRKP